MVQSTENDWIKYFNPSYLLRYIVISRRYMMNNYLSISALIFPVLKNYTIQFRNKAFYVFGAEKTL